MSLFKKQKKHTYFGVTHPGKVRPNNEDFLFYNSKEGLYIVSDGMGGHNAGEVASREAVSSIKDGILNAKKLENSTDMETGLKDIMMMAHKHVIQKAKEVPEYRGMGCTVSLAYLQDDHSLHTCHVGDSRLYIMNEKGVEQIGTDHSVVAQAVKSGQMTSEEAEKCNFKNKLTMAIGAAVEVDPEYQLHTVKKNDRVLICSDGLWSMVSDEDMRKTCLQYEDAKNICEVLLEKAIEAGGYDNIAIILFII